ncbi:MAG: hypothetical protein U0R19_22890 [Bryobacteraceae bacterium]
MDLLNWSGTAIAVFLQLAIIYTLLRGTYRSYPMLFVYIAVSFLATIASASAILGMREWTAYAAKVFWFCELLQYLFIFALQVHMLSQAMSGPPSRRRILYLVAGGVLFATLAIWTAHHPRLNLWMTQAVRNFGFGSMILNLALWTTLLRNPDRCRLMITAAIGIMLAGEAIGHSLRQLAKSLVLFGNLVLIVTYLLMLFLVWRALMRYSKNTTEGPSAALHPAG